MEWLDSLSEDWPSQPPSRQSSLVFRSSSPSSYASQSRIPRLKPSGSIGASSASGKELSRAASPNHTDQTNRALRIRRPSSLNVSHKQDLNLTPKVNQTDVKPGQENASKTFPRSPSEIELGTVQHKSLPKNDERENDTPEWKKRLLQGKKAGIDQTDLFAPMGLENVFKPPTIAVRPEAKRAVVEAVVEAHTPAFDSRKDCDNDKLTESPICPSSAAQDKDQDEDQDGDYAWPMPPKNNDREASDKGGHIARSCEVSTQRVVTSDTIASRRLPDESDLTKSEHGRNEDISPYYVSRHHTIDGRVDYAAAIDMSLRTIQSKIERQQKKSGNVGPCFTISDDGVTCPGSATPRRSMLQCEMDEITRQSLPGDLSMGTDAYVANGGFVNIRRGGYSTDGSFQRRTLSPSSSTCLGAEELDGSDLHHQTSSDAYTPRTPPRTPRNKDEMRKGSSSPPKSSGSPLKLFDKHDTFTMNRLARQISRFEETLGRLENEIEVCADPARPPTPSPGPKKSKKPVKNSKQGSAYQPRVSSFGSSELDQHRFSSENGLPKWPQKVADSTKKVQERSKVQPQSESLHFSTHQPAEEGYQKELSPDQCLESSTHSGDGSVIIRGGPKIEFSIHGKRLPHSPMKSSTKKRRKTLDRSEEQERPTLSVQSLSYSADVSALPTTQSQGRKRKDARYIDEDKTADPEVIASRRIRRLRGSNLGQPRGPRRDGSGRSEPDTSEDVVQTDEEQEPQKHDKSSVLQLDPPTQMVAGALATIALNAAQDATHGSRKASVTTSDFFNEAQYIMALIRADKRPRSSQSTADASTASNITITEESGHADSTRDNFSRPPSRETTRKRESSRRSIRDARIASHLRKFEDEDDLGFALTSSLKSLRVSPGNRRSVDSLPDPEEPKERDDVLSDPPNIRIIERIRSHTDGTADVPDNEGEYQELAAESQIVSQDSSKRSVGTDTQTGSSRSSFTMKKIAPESVAHLLSDQMADMIFNHDRKVWVKRKGSTSTANENQDYSDEGSASQEDFFGDIPDLSVDEMEELKRVQHAVFGSSASTAGRADTALQDDVKNARSGVEPEAIPLAGGGTRPKTADGRSIPPGDDSSAPSKYSHFAWSGPLPGTRATSYGDDIPSGDKIQLPQNEQIPEEDAESSGDDNDVEREFSMLEGRDSYDLPQQAVRKHQARVVTVAFSSPLVQSPDSPNDRLEDTSLFLANESPSQGAHPSQATARRGSHAIVRKSLRPRGSHRASLRDSSLIPRPMSRVDENEEFSLVHCATKEAQIDTHTYFSTPHQPSENLAITPKAGHRTLSDFELSPLPDFTLHQVDRPLEGNDNTIAKRNPSNAVSNTLSLTAQELLKHLTDLEPYEPYWEYLRAVDLSNRGLQSMHMLEEFCSRTVELDISQNQVRELEGIPISVRLLNIRGNNLSDLTAWHNLMNLQYLDVSNNRLRTLSGLSSLVHLRGLRADDNEIENIDGIGKLDALLNLSVAGNSLRLVDFEMYNL